MPQVQIQACSAIQENPFEDSRRKFEALTQRLSKGENRNTKRMATVAAVYSISPFFRQPEQVVSDLRRKSDKPLKRPRPQSNRLWASVEKRTTMPHRAYHLLLGVAGLFAVAALLIAGADLLRHSRSGPGWKRRLVSAGMLLLGALGFGSLGGTAACPGKTTDGEKAASSSAPTVQPPRTEQHTIRPPNTSSQPDPAGLWKEIQSVEAEAELISRSAAHWRESASSSGVAAAITAALA